MGSDKVVSTIVQWASTALRDHPVLVAPTLIILVGVLGLAILEGANITIQVATAMVRNYRHRLAELRESVRELRDELRPRRQLKSLDKSAKEVTRTNVVQHDMLAQQRLFDRAGHGQTRQSKSR